MKKYDFASTEKKFKFLWQEKKLYVWDKDATREENFVIDTPPPTVSGTLHFGHLFSYCHADFIARFKRMIGKNVFIL